MDYLTLISKLVEALAWPVAIVVICLTLKEGVIKLLPKLKQLKYKELQLDFDKDIKKVGAIAESSNLPKLESIIAHTELNTAKSPLFQLCETYPRAAMLESWILLEAKIGVALQNQKLITSGEKLSGIYSPVNAGTILFKNDYPEKFGYFEELRRIRNELAHGVITEINIESAKAYVEVAFRLMIFIENTWPNKLLERDIGSAAAPQ